MKAIVDLITRIPLLIIYLLGGAYYVYSEHQRVIQQEVEPLRQQHAQAESSLNQKLEELKKAENFKIERDKKLQELQNLSVELEKASEQLPKKANISELLTIIGNLIDRMGLDLINLKPLENRKKELISEIPINITFEGTYIQMMSFVDTLSHLKRIMRVTKLQTSNPILKQKEARLKVEMEVVAYYFGSGD